MDDDHAPDEPAPPRRDARPRSRRALWAFLLVALVPVVGSLVRVQASGWRPEGDDAMIARRAMAVFSTRPPLTGQPSTSGNLFTRQGGALRAAAIDASHPGPLEYYLLAVPYRLGGWSPTGLLVAVGLITASSAAAVVWLAWRRLGTAGAAAGAVAVLVVAARLGALNLSRPLNASILVLPLLAGLVGTWAVLDGDRVALLPTVLALSLVIQAHLASAPLGALLLVTALAAHAAHLLLPHLPQLRVQGDHARPPETRSSESSATATHPLPQLRVQGDHEQPAETRSSPTDDPDDRTLPQLRVQGDHEQPAETRSSGGWRGQGVALASGLVLLACWTVVLVEQVSGDPGNVTRLRQVAGLHPDRAGLGFGLAAVASRVGHLAWPGMAPIGRIAIIGPIPASSVLLGGVLIAGVLVGVGVVARWHRDATLARLLAVCVAAVVVPTALLAFGPDEVRLGPAYQLTSLVAVSALLAFAATATVLRLADPRLRALAPSVRAALVPVAAAVLALLGVVTVARGGPTYSDDSHRIARLGTAIRQEVPRGTYLLSADGNWAYLSTLDAISVDLLQHSYDVRLIRLGAVPVEPQRRDTDVDAPTIVVSSTDKVPAGGRLLARLGPTTDDLSWAGGLDAALRHPGVQVTVVGRVPHGPAAPACLAAVDRAARATGIGDTPGRRVALAHAVLDCPQAARRQAVAHLRFEGLDRFWVDLLGSSMVAPYPPSDLSAYLVPAPRGR